VVYRDDGLLSVPVLGEPGKAWPSSPWEGLGKRSRECALGYQLREHFEVASRPAAKIEYRERRVTLDGLQQRLDVLVDVVIARAFPEIFGMLVVMFQREVGDFFQVLRIQFHVRSGHTDCAASAHGANSVPVEARPDVSQRPAGRSDTQFIHLCLCQKSRGQLYRSFTRRRDLLKPFTWRQNPRNWRCALVHLLVESDRRHADMLGQRHICRVGAAQHAFDSHSRRAA